MGFGPEIRVLYSSHFSEGYRGAKFLATAVTHLLLERLYIPFLIPERLAFPLGIILHPKYSKSDRTPSPIVAGELPSCWPEHVVSAQLRCRLRMVPAAQDPSKRGAQQLGFVHIW